MTNDEGCLPKVSVIVPVYNGEADLPELISCLRAQTYRAEAVEYLLVDNGSHDRTAAIIQTAIKKAASQGITLRYLEEDAIQSSYAARNTGIRAAQGQIIAFTDADCRPQPDWLELLVIPLAKTSIGMAVGEIIALPGKTLLEQHAENNQVLSQQHTLAHPFYPYGQTANLAVKRQILEQIGLFRPYLTTGGDADICWRMQQQTDWQLDFVPTAIVKHRHRSTLTEYSHQWRRYGCSNRYLHELHGVELMRELTTSQYLYRLSRWLLKELPVNSIKAIAHQTPPIEIIGTPIGLFGAWARTAGQKTAQLPDQAREIAWLDDAPGLNEHEPQS
ncbi:MAG: glycosyltransferase [Symploca sp. SIO1C2]|nr:glycosyltransferase [Symploca sp. SIO1C2]